MKVSIVEEVDYGMYIWQLPDGKFVTDGEGGYLSIPSKKGDVRRIKHLKDTAKSYGLEGRPVYWTGHRPVTEEEYENQKLRMEWGLVPDEMDLPALMEDLKKIKRKWEWFNG